jgi:VWFA-related protein
VTGTHGLITHRRRHLIAGAALLLAGYPLGARAPQVFRAGIDLVQVQATVTDKDGRLVQRLGRSDFIVREDGVDQEIAFVSSERLPVSLGILIDTSDSMFGRRMADARSAFDRFVLELLAPSDEVFLLLFNHEPHRLVPWTVPPRGLAHRLDEVRPSGGTAIYDTLVSAVEEVESRRHQRCGFVLISDGADNSSDHTLADAVRALAPADVFVYAIGIDEPDGPAIARAFSPQALNSITGPTGGYTEVIKDSAQLARATERIADELNHQYTLAYRPGHAADGKYHSIFVRTRDSSQVVRARRGYLHTLRTRR